MKKPGPGRRTPGAILRRGRGAWAAAALLAACAPAAARAQAADTVAGHVRDPRGAPVAGASVRAAGDDGRAHAARTDARGAFLVAVPRSAGGRYVLTVQQPGFAPHTALVARPAAGGPITADVRLATRTVALDTVQVRGSRVRLGGERRTPGQGGAAWSAALAEGLPVEPGALAGTAGLEPGVARVGGAEGAGGISVAGQSPSQNQTAVDGATFGGASLPPEAVRSTGVISSTYDVARGQFSGAVVAATTRSGTNLWGGAASASGRDPALAFGAGPGQAPPGRDRWVQVDGGGGGPLVRDRLFAYGAFQLSSRAAAASFLDPDDRAGLRQLGVSADSARRFAEIVRGLGAAGAAEDPRAGYASGLVRLDAEVGPRHSLALRLDGRSSRASGLGDSPLRLPGVGGTQESSAGGALLQLTRRGARWAGEVRAYASGSRTGPAPGGALPAGVVRVRSGDDGAALLGFGGSPAAAPRLAGRLGEAAADLTWESPGGAHSVRVGSMVQGEAASVGGTANAAGTFTFASLADLEAGRPASFTRSLGSDERTAGARYAAAYAGDTWRPGERLQLMYGVRVEGAWYADHAGAAGLAARFGGEAGRVPAEWRVSPRAGFRWEPGWGRNVSLHGGVGAFRGRVPLRALAGALGETGAAGGAVRLFCAGAAAPLPAWEGYAAGASALPAACADGVPALAERAPQATLFAPGFAAPRVWRGSLGTSMQLANGRFLQVEGSLLRGAGQPLATELNLAGAPAFRLAGEGGRPVYAPASAVDPVSGAASPGAARTFGDLAGVRRVEAEGRSWAGQLTVGVQGLLHRTSTFGAYYTHTRARDLAAGVPSPGGAGATTAGDPRTREWATGDFEQRHALRGMVDYRVRSWLSVAAIGSLTSGLPFTPSVDGDVNGDGYANDRAFAFDPARAPDLEVAAGMRELLDRSPARGCLREALGSVAGRNVCRTPWNPTLDLLAYLRPTGNSRRLRVSVRASNVTAGLDYLLHGPSGLRGWGQLPFADATLLRVRGFDADAAAYRYEVNPRFGEVLGARGFLRTPATVTLQARFTLGADPAYQSFARTVAALGRASPERVRARLGQSIFNAPVQALAANATAPLGLTPDQVVRLAAAGDSLRDPVERVVHDLGDALRVPPATRSAAHRARIEELSREGMSLVARGQEAVRAVLSPEQWGALPASLTAPPREAGEGAQSVTIPTG